MLSLSIHLLFVLLLCVGILPFASRSLEPVPNKESSPPPEVIFDLSPSTTMVPTTVRTDSEHPLEKPPEHPAFESHENTEASSELPATGSLPLPTQEGVESEGVELKTSETLGRKTPDSTVTAEAAPTTTPTPSPTGSTSVDAPAVTPMATASSDRPVMGILSSSAKTQSESSGAHPSMIHGAISNKGKSSVTAEATPLGRYKKNLADAISSHWYYAIDQRMELLSFGTATVIFYVTQNGKVEELRIISNSSNQTFADCCIESITGAKLPSIPPEIAQTLDRGRLEIEYRFTIYP